MKKVPSRPAREAARKLRPKIKAVYSFPAEVAEEAKEARPEPGAPADSTAPPEWTGLYKEGVFNGHRTRLLLETPEFMSEWETLGRLVDDILSLELMCAPTPRCEPGETLVDAVITTDAVTHARYQEVCHAFERRWRVVVTPLIDAQHDQIRLMLFEEVQNPVLPTVLDGDVPQQVVDLAAHFPGRFAVVDLTMSRTNTWEVLRDDPKSILRTKGKKTRTYQLANRKQFKQDVEMLRVNPRRAADFKPFRVEDHPDPEAEMKALKTRIRVLRSLVKPTDETTFP